MKLNYDQETDSLYIDLNSRPSADSREIQDGVVIDVDAKGKIVGIDIQHASNCWTWPPSRRIPYPWLLFGNREHQRGSCTANRLSLPRPLNIQIDHLADVCCIWAAHCVTMARRFLASVPAPEYSADQSSAIGREWF